MRVPSKIIFLLVGVSTQTLSAASIVLSEARRIEFVEGLESLLSYQIPPEEELRLLPDPFLFGREIEEEKQEAVVEGLTNKDLIERIAQILSDNIIGYQNFGTRSFLATKDFGLLREGRTISITLEETRGAPLAVEILDLTNSSLTIGLEDLQTSVSLKNESSGVQPTQP